MNRKEINQTLKRFGFAGLHEKALLSQISVLISDHPQFKKLLTAVEPSKRYDCYEAMRPHLMFTPKPLDVYLAEAAMDAERLKLPAYDHTTGTFTEYKPVEITTNAVDAKASEVPAE